MSILNKASVIGNTVPHRDAGPPPPEYLVLDFENGIYTVLGDASYSLDSVIEIDTTNYGVTDPLVPIPGEGLKGENGDGTSAARLSFRLKGAALAALAPNDTLCVVEWTYVLPVAAVEPLIEMRGFYYASSDRTNQRGFECDIEPHSVGFNTVCRVSVGSTNTNWSDEADSESYLGTAWLVRSDKIAASVNGDAEIALLSPAAQPPPNYFSWYLSVNALTPELQSVTIKKLTLYDLNLIEEEPIKNWSSITP